MKIIVCGDFSPKYSLKKVVKERDTRVLEEIKPFTAKSDFSIVNFETTVECDSDSILKCGPSLSSPVEGVALLKDAGFNVVTLANNHIMDFGAVALRHTVNELDRAGFRYVGVGENKKTCAEPLILKKKDKSLAIINCCEHEFSIATETSAGANAIDPVSMFYQINDAKAKADRVIVIAHGGHEHYQLPSVRMQDLFRYFIDCGADAVINHHQHCFSGYEVYKGSPIFYGLGNFLFDKPQFPAKKAPWFEGYFVELDITDNGIEFQLHPYTQCLSDYRVKLLDATTDFLQKLQELNRVIADRTALLKENEAYAIQRENDYLQAFGPSYNRYYRFAVRHGFLPRILNKKRLTYIYDIVACEAHRDLLLKSLISSISK